MEPITSASAIVGLVGAITDQAIRAGGYAHKEIKAAYTGTQAEQAKLAAAQNYVRRYDQRHCQVKVMPGLMKEPLPLEEIYTAVKLLDDQSIRYFIGLDELEETYRAKGRRSFGRGEGERQDGMVVANAEQYLMVLGGPGIGKSTFLRKIGLEALKPQADETKQIHRDCLPVLIELKEFRDETVDLKQKIADEFAACGFPEAKAFTEASLAQGKLLVLLDGLDEVPTRNLTTVIEHIEDFVDAHDQNTFVASCRIAAYRSSQGAFFNRFTDVTLAEFDNEQIEQFIRRWFRSQLDDEAETADRYWELLQKDEHKATKELAQTPLLLTFLCLVYDREQTLPAQRSTLYGKALNILLSEWAAQKRLEQDPIYEGFHPDLEKVLLAEIAYESFKNDQLFFLKDDLTRRISEFLADTLDAPKYLDGAKVLEAIEKQQGILVERATDIYSFSHLTLQEYLTAFHIVDERLENNLVSNHLLDRRFQEVFLLASGLRGNKAIEFLMGIENHLKDHTESHYALIRVLQWAGSVVSQTDRIRLISKKLFAVVIYRRVVGWQASSMISKQENYSIYSLGSQRETSIEYSILSLAEKHGSNEISTQIIYFLVCINLGFIISELVDIQDSSESLKQAINSTIEAFQILGERTTKLNKIPFKDIFDVTQFEELLSSLAEIMTNAPYESRSPDSWQSWAKYFRATWADGLNVDVKVPELTNEENIALENYLYGLDLLLRCKDAAVRVPKQAWSELEARLLTV